MESTSQQFYFYLEGLALPRSVKKQRKNYIVKLDAQVKLFKKSNIAKKVEVTFKKALLFIRLRSNQIHAKKRKNKVLEFHTQVKLFKNRLLLKKYRVYRKKAFFYF